MIEKIIRYVSEQLSIDESELNEKTEIIDDLGADSLDIVEILLRIEEELGVSVPDEAVIEMKTIGDMAKYVEKNM